MPGRQRKITMRPQTSGSGPEKHPDIVIIGRLYSPKSKLQSGYFLATVSRTAESASAWQLSCLSGMISRSPLAHDRLLRIEHVQDHDCRFPRILVLGKPTAGDHANHDQTGASRLSVVSR
jgi:hypothetical protein